MKYVSVYLKFVFHILLIILIISFVEFLFELILPISNLFT